MTPRIADTVHCWVCENHPARPWGGMCCESPPVDDICVHGACHCGGAGQPCTHPQPDGPETTT